MSPRRPVFWLVLLCFAIPAAMFYYKAEVLRLSLLPHKVDDVWLLHVSVRPKDPTATSVSFPIPRSGDGLKVTDERTRGKGIDTLVDRNHDSAMMTWLAREPFQKRVVYTARVDINPVLVKDIPKDSAATYPPAAKRYLKGPALAPAEKEAVRTLAAAIFEGNEDKTAHARKAFYYVDEEIQRNVRQKDMVEALSSGKASPLVKARLFAALCREGGVPARVVAMLRLPLPGEPAEDNYHLTFANEVFLNNRWVPVDTNRGLFGERPDRYLVLHRHFESIEKGMARTSYTIRAERAVMNRFNKAGFYDEVKLRGPWLASLSLYRLPLPVQAVFATILLIPVGTLVLCFARNLLGVPTFGMFTPILLTVFFKETTLAFGLMFFLVVVLLGFLERWLLDRLYLLALPRLSVLLTLVIIFLMAVSLTGATEYFGVSHFGYFPIVIVTVFIERFSIMLTEEGPVNTLKTLLGTLVISLLAYALYSFDTLEILVFTNPELLLAVIGLLILVGKYKGYRLSEFIRFRDLVKQVKARQGDA